MAFVTSIFGGETLDRGTSTEVAGEGKAPRGFLLSDQEYHDIYIRPKEEEILRGAESTTGSLARGSRAKQGQFFAAQGLGGTALANQAGATMNESFQRAVRRARQGARMEAEELRRREFAERDRTRAEELQKVAQASQVASAAMSAIPYAGPALAAAEGIQGAAWSAGLSDTPRRRTTSDYLEVMDFGDQGGGQSMGGTGGGYDLYA